MSQQEPRPNGPNYQNEINNLEKDYHLLYNSEWVSRYAYDVTNKFHTSPLILSYQ